MSLSSAPEQTGALEFYIRFVGKPESENPLTHLMWELSPGDKLYMTRKPVGKFTIEGTCGSEEQRSLIFVAAGTGLAPFVSMCRSSVLQDPKADLSKYILLHGASYPDDLCYRDELDRYRVENNLHYFKTISRPKEAPDWEGDTGRVEDYFLEERLAELEEGAGLGEGGLNPDKVAVLICGLQGTIAQTIIRLSHRGFVPDHRRIRKALEVPEEQPPAIWWEQYDTTPVIDVKDVELVESLKAQLLPALPKV